MHENLFVLQPMAVISSLPYFFFGLYIFYRYREYTFSSILALTGISSAFMHASFNNLARTFDFLSIFLVSAWIFYQLQDRYKNKKKIFFFLVFVPSISLILLPQHPFLITALTFIPTIIITYKNRANTYIRKSILTSTLACLCFYLDQHRLLCFDEIGLHGHSLWHLLSALSTYYYFRVAKN